MKKELFPKAVLKLLKENGINEEDIFAASATDMNTECQYADGFVVLTLTGLIIITSAPDPHSIHSFKGYMTKQKAPDTIQKEWSLRIYDISDTDFTIGSWVFDKQSPIGSAILAEIITREIGFELYPEKNCCWDTKKNNVNVIQYGLSYHPDVYKETEDTIYCRCTKENNDKYKKKYLRMLLR